MDIDRDYQSFARDVEAAIEADQLILPSAPDAIMRIRQKLEDPQTSTGELASLIATDTALAARILKVANSVIYKTHASIDNLQQAIARLGLKLIQTLVTSHAMMQLFARQTALANTPFAKQLKSVQERSGEVARLSYAIARHNGRLSADDALLAGLVHDIGYLPLLQALAKSVAAQKIDQRLSRFLKHAHPDMGARILDKWKFPQAFIDVAREHEQLERKGSGMADLVDVVIIANLLLHEQRRPEKDIRLLKARVPAFVRLGLDPDFSIARIDEHMEAARQLLPAA